MLGKDIRMERIFDRKSGNAVIVPMDHGISIGPIDGLIDVRNTVDEISAGGATAVLMQKGLVRFGHNRERNDIGLIVHLSASTDIGTTEDDKVLVCTVDEAVRAGADAVSMHINLGSDTEPRMLTDLGNISRECSEKEIPLMVMAYPRGPKVKDPFDQDLIAHCARVATELGADIVKVPYTGDVDSFREVVRGALVPVLIAGGPKIKSDMDVLNMVKDSIDAGGRGVSIGRNIFQNSNVRGMTQAITDIVLHGASVEEAKKHLVIQ